MTAHDQHTIRISAFVLRLMSPSRSEMQTLRTLLSSV